MYWGEKKVIAIGSGNSEIGKSTFVANIGMALAQSGKRVIVVDAGTGVTNLHTILGIKDTPKTFNAFLSTHDFNLENYLVETQYNNLLLLSSPIYTSFQKPPSYYERHRVFHAIHNLTADVIIFDNSTSAQQRATDFFSLAPIGILIIQPTQESTNNAFLFLKNLLLRGLLRRFYHEKNLTELIQQAIQTTDEHRDMDFNNLLHILEEKSPGKVSAYRQLFLEGICAMCIVSNDITDNAQLQISKQFSETVKNELGLPMTNIGNLPHVQDMALSINIGAPYIAKYPESTYAQEMKLIVDNLDMIKASDGK